MVEKISSLNELNAYLKNYNHENNLIELENEIIKRFDFLNKHRLCTLREDQVQTWLNNFNSKLSHKFIALYILQSITFRSYEMMESSFTRMISKNLKNTYENKSNQQINDIEEWLDIIRFESPNCKSKVKVRFYSIDKSKGGITQSSSTILRRLLSKTISQMRLLDNIEGVLDSIQKGDTIVFVDDFLGSGKQSSDFFSENNLQRVKRDNGDNATLIYMPLMATSEGITKLNEDVPDLFVFPCEIVHDTCKLSKHFSLNDFLKKFGIQSQQADMETLFTEMRQYYNFIKKQSWFGRNRALLSIVFDWGCPNQTVALIYHDTHMPKPNNAHCTNVFNPLTSRRDV